MTTARRATPLLSAALALGVAASIAGCAVLDGPDEAFEDPSVSIGPVPTLDPHAPPPRATGTPAPLPTQDTLLHGPFRRAGAPVPPAVLASAERTCRSIPAGPTVEEIGSKPVVVSDIRGLGTVILVFGDDLGATGCRLHVGEDGSTSAGLFPVDADTKTPIADDDITLGTLRFLEDGSGQYVLAVGRVGSLAVHVRAGFDDDTFVTSTPVDGWWAMWWAGQLKPAVIAADDNRNTVISTAELDLP